MEGIHNASVPNCSSSQSSGGAPYRLLLALGKLAIGSSAIKPLKRAVRERQNLYHATEVLIEDRASGTPLIEELIADGCHGVTCYLPEGDKIMQMHAQTAMIENGFVYVPQSRLLVVEGAELSRGGTAAIPDRGKGVKEGRIMSARCFLTWQFTHARGGIAPIRREPESRPAENDSALVGSGFEPLVPG